MSLTVVDWAALALVALAALGGMRRGLVLTGLSLAGLAAGAYAGSRVGPHLLHGGAGSAWTPLAGLIGALVGAFLLQSFASFAGSFVRGGLRLTPLRFLDSAGGLLLGAATGVALVWVAAAVALLAPHQSTLRQEVQRSTLVRRLNSIVPPRTLLHLLARVDPFPSIAGPPAPSEPPSTGVLKNPQIYAASKSVVKILGTACGYGVEGSGWVAGRDLVVTAAHVVAGESDTTIQIAGRSGQLPASVVAFDVHDDVAVLRVPGLSLTPLALADPRDGASVAIVGYPENGGLHAIPGRIGTTSVVVTEDALGHGPVTRQITAVAGQVRHGNSGGPAIDVNGAVESTIFAARIGSPSGYGVPPAVVRKVLDLAGTRAVSTGSCAP